MRRSSRVPLIYPGAWSCPPRYMQQPEYAMGMLMSALCLSRQTARRLPLLHIQQLLKAVHVMTVIMCHSTSSLARSAGADLDCM